MKRIFLSITTTALFLSLALVVTAENLDFSGKWTLDKARSEGLPVGMDQTMTVTQSGNKISTETKVIIAQGAQTISDSYVLDGKETEFTPNGDSAKGKRTAKWTADGINVRETVTYDTEDGTMTMQIIRKWSLSADGKTLKIEMSQQSPNGTKEFKRTFLKK